MKHRSAHPVQPWDPLELPGPASPAPEQICLEPTAEFPAELWELTVPELQILHSRLCRQLNHDHLHDPAGSHPVTMARYRRVVLALDMRAAAPGSVRTGRR